MAADLAPYHEFDDRRLPAISSDPDLAELDEYFDRPPRARWLQVAAGAVTVVLSVIGSAVGLTPKQDR